MVKTFTRRYLPIIILSTSLCLPIFACNVETLGAEEISQTELIAKLDAKKPLLILDVRSQKEYEEGHIPGAINIEFREIPDRINEIANYKNSTVVVYCERGIRAAVAERTLNKEGFSTILHLEGHMSAWRSNDLPVASE